MFPFTWFLRRRKAELAREALSGHPITPTAMPEQRRIYLPGLPYLLPKDAQEDERLKFQHYALHHAFGNHYLAPLSPQTRTILDVGCGTGIWAMDMAHQFPQAQIVGIDIALTSLHAVLPETCVFCQADVLQGLPFPDQQFSFTHQRLMVLAIPAGQWPPLVRELVRVTRPQGWIELLEAATTVQHAGPATEQLLGWLQETACDLGHDLSQVTSLGELLRQAGCQAVEAQDIPVPLGSWAGRGGEMLKLDALRVFQALQPRSALAPEPFARMLQEAATEWERNHAYYVFHLAYGRREAL